MYSRVAALKKEQVQQVRMRYEVFFNAMAGQLDGTMRYTDYDAVYLRVRGFTLRNEAPRLGRFLVTDFMHYIAERRRSGVNTLFIIDEFNALRMREETSILFEQVRSFGGSLIIAAQGYTGLGPHDYADRILDAANTHIVHACSDPFPILKRAGKRLVIETSWSEQEGTEQRRHIRPRWEWKVSEDAVKQQEEGQAFWMYRGHARHVQMARVPITTEGVRQAWNEIREIERQQQETLAAVRPPAPVQQPTPPSSSQSQQKPRQKKLSSAAALRASDTSKKPTLSGGDIPAQPSVPSPAASPPPLSTKPTTPTSPSPITPPPRPIDASPSQSIREPDDDGPEYL